MFPRPAKDTTPLALRANLQQHNAFHERVVLITERTDTVAHIPRSQPPAVDNHGDPGGRCNRGARPCVNNL